MTGTARGEPSTEMKEIYSVFNRGVATAVAISGGAIIPVGLALSGIFAGWGGFVGALVGFGVASLNTIASIAILKWSFRRKPSSVPAIIYGAFVLRLLALLGILFALTMQSAFDRVSMLVCFFVLFLDYQVIEAYFSLKAFGLLTRGSRRKPA